METFLVHVPFRLDLQDLFKKTHTRPGSDLAEDLTTMALQAQTVADARFAYRTAFIDARGKNWVEMDGIRFNSRVLRLNLGENQRAFPFLVSCGMAMYEWSLSFDDLLYRYWADCICELAVMAALKGISEHLEQRFQVGHLTTMNPGSLEDWPITQQMPLFELLGDLPEQAGVSLTDSQLMIPVKSVSGLCFAAEETFESCQLCPRPNCPNRRAEYLPGLFDQKYA